MTESERMERAQWDWFWCPPDARIINRPEIQYMTCPRPVTYLNSVVRTNAPDRRLPALVAEVSAAHAHTQSRWLIYDARDDGSLVDALRGGGYSLLGRAQGMILDVDEYQPRTTHGIRVARAEDVPRSRECDQIADAAFKANFERTDDEYVDQLRHCVGPGARVFRAVAYDESGRAISSGSMNLYPALDLAYLWGGATSEDARGCGGYSAIVAARIAYARENGIAQLGVYADADTSAPILTHQGFRQCGDMSCWIQPPATVARTLDPS